jgi:hypothetical protein
MCRWEAHGGWWSDIMHAFPPLLGWGQATQAQLVLGKMEGMVDGWCWGWRGGVADYWGTKNEKGEGKNLACGPG